MAAIEFFQQRGLTVKNRSVASERHFVIVLIDTAEFQLPDYP